MTQKTYRVIQWATGVVGKTALRHFIENPSFELVGVLVTNPEKVYFPRTGHTKLDLVRYYLAVEEPLMRAVGGSTDDHDAEFDEVRWVDLSEALALMTHATERSVVEEAARALGAGSGPDAVAAEASA